MTVGPVLPGGALAPLTTSHPSPMVDKGPSFGDRVSSAFGELQASQAKASQSATAWELGIENDLAAVMVDQQVSSLGFQLALNVRNKALGAYRDIMNMPL